MNTLVLVLYHITAQLERESDILSIIYRSSIIAKIVFAILLFFSVVSWAIIIDKYFVLRKAKKLSRIFFKVFKSSKSFKEVLNQCQKLKGSPFVGMFISANSELQYQVEHYRPDAAGSSQFTVNTETISRQLVRSANAEVDRFQSQLSFLATTASATPFIGLFGTVIGIINAFEAIGRMGSTDLSIVAPGIAEALIATAMGLAAAIPGVIGYNYCVNQIKFFTSEMEDFSSEFISIIERFYKSSAPGSTESKGFSTTTGGTP